jgi:GTP-binding protein
VPFERDGERYTLIDTAGVRRRARVDEAVEKFSVIKTLQAIETAHVVVVVMDAHDTVAEQDASLLGTVIEQGRALILAVNKWDNIPTEQRDLIRQQVEQRLEFAAFAPLHFISARHGSGVGELFGAVRKVYAAATRDMATPELTRVLEAAIESHQPPLVSGRRIKLRYAHQGGQNPPVIVIHGNQTDHVPDAYRRYLVNVFRKAFELRGKAQPADTAPSTQTQAADSTQQALAAPLDVLTRLWQRQGQRQRKLGAIGADAEISASN